MSSQLFFKSKYYGKLEHMSVPVEISFNENQIGSQAFPGQIKKEEIKERN